MFTKFFITRPIFASVLSAVILLAGAISLPTLPVAHYPNITPPQVSVDSVYIGANAAAVESSVTNPLERAVNGVEGLRYISSTSGDDGTSNIVATFNLGRDLDRAVSDVQSRVSTATGVLPAQVNQTGIAVTKNSSTFIMALSLTSTNPKYDTLFLSNYADRYVTVALKRVKGVANVIIFGERRYAMRLWLDPAKLQAYGLTADDVTTALNQQNVQVAAGAFGQPPAPTGQAYEYKVKVAGQLASPAEFANIVVKSGPGYLVRVSDVGRVALGAESYAANLYFNDAQHDRELKPAIGLGVLQLQDANSLSVSRGVRATMDELAKQFPPGVSYHIAFDSTVFVNQSIVEVTKTLALAISLVILTIFFFLQDWKTTLIPAITIPVSLLGTFALLKVFGFSINVLTLFGLTLATALVVDDAIVVIENIVRYIQEHKKDPIEAAPLAMQEIASAVIATSLVLLAVFVPVAFFPGETGALYKQFALTIASTITISAFTALTLAPALAAIMLESGETRHNKFMQGVAAFIHRVRAAYARRLPAIIRHPVPVLIIFAGLMVLTVVMLRIVPTGFVPDEDQGYFIIVEQGPPGVSLQYTDKIMGAIYQTVRSEPDIVDVFSVSGFSFTGVGSNNGIVFCLLKPWDERKRKDQSAQAIENRLNGKFFGITGATTFAFNPPAFTVGNISGFDFELEDRTNLGIPALAATTGLIEYKANTNPNLSSVFTTFRADSPQVELDVDRNAVLASNVKLSDVFDTLQTMLGSNYVNNFTYENNSYKVFAQADAPYRSQVDNLSMMYVRSADNTLIPLTSLIRVQHTLGAPEITHYNLFRSVEFSGNPAPGKSSGQAIAAMQEVAKQTLPQGMAYEWTGVSLDQIEAGSVTVLIFGLAVVFVFLVLAAQYESLVDPLIIIMAVPLAILGALTAVWVRGLQNDIYTQIGLVMLVGLATKNGILIVQFGNLLRQQGVPVAEAAVMAARTRLRPILMTSFAFIFGIMPLVFATGAGEASRHSIGTAVVGGMLVSTLLNLFLIPVLYVLIAGAEERMRERGRRARRTPEQA
ncbi:MAG: efflux RND transporter permease subunit [Candidatus Eremiobacteraeota bacterium]|nr:efflux RND transporter permease subunit [Candidatus Eremiobacteraeota bacterium]